MSKARSRRAASEFGHGLARYGGVFEGMRHRADDLAALMPLAGDEEEVTRREERERAADRGGAVADLFGLGAGGENGAANEGGILAARIVVGDDDVVGEAVGDPSHLRPLAGVAVAAAAEDDDELAAAMSAQRREHGFERIGRVGLIDNDTRTTGMSRDMLQTTGHALKLRQGIERAVHDRAGRDRKAECRHRIARLESADQRQHEVAILAKDRDMEMLARIERPCRDEAQIGTGCRAEGEDVLTALPAELDETLALERIDV